MKYRGHIQGGLVVLDRSPSLRDGTVVDVEPVSTASQTSDEAAQPVLGSARAILRHAGIWSDESEEVNRLLAELRAGKEAELHEQNKSENEASRD
jgi:hypothetical protein